MHLVLSLGRVWPFVSIAGYWLLAALVILFRPSEFQLFMLGIPLVILSVVVCVRARRRDRSD